MSENKNWERPSWLTDTYLKDVLKKYLNDEQVKITNVDIKPATADGENYVSVMTRIKIEFIQEKLNKKPQELSLILKYSFDNDPFVSEIMSGYDVYNTEIKMYEHILPQLANILEETGDTESLFAKTLKVQKEQSAIMFEDLTQQNYVLADRIKGLDENHAHLVLKKIAKFHAAAAVLNTRLNGELEQFQRGLFNRHTRAGGCLFEYLFEVCAKYAKNCPALGPYYHDKLMKLKPHIIEYGIKAHNSNPKHFYTLCHGDLWTNNIMMLYDSKDKKLIDLLLIDFQLCNWSSPAVDLFYFFHSSLESKLLVDVHALNKLVQHYHKILIESLRRLNFQGHIPTLHELHVQLTEGQILALTTALVIRAVTNNDQCEDANLQSLFKDDEKGRNFRTKLYQNERLQSQLKILLPYFDQIGLLDVQE